MLSVADSSVGMSEVFAAAVGIADMLDMANVS